MSEKLGSWIFELPQCPSNTTAVVANRGGSVYWYTGDRPHELEYTSNGCWKHLPGHGSWREVSGVFVDTDGWPNGCIIVGGRGKNLCAANVKRMEE